MALRESSQDGYDILKKTRLTSGDQAAYFSLDYQTNIILSKHIVFAQFFLSSISKSTCFGTTITAYQFIYKYSSNDYNISSCTKHFKLKNSL